MPIPTPFHARTSALCQSQEWRNWSGYLAAAVYDPSHEHEYYAIRDAAALIDVSPLFKYEISGPDAVTLVDRIVTRDVTHCALGQVIYSPWCDDDGKVIDDGTVARLEKDRFRISAADPNLAWFEDCAYGLQVRVADVTTELAALALQGPKSRQILTEVVAGIDFESLKYYRLAQGYAAGFPLTITRTGYTGDLGYESWIDPTHADQLWDLLMEKGQGYGITPAGMVALDIARIEAGLVMIEVDYKSARKALIEAQKSSPYELGMGWAVDLKKPAFVGRKALLDHQRSAARWQLVGLEVHWESLQALYQAVDLAPQLTGRASRAAVPIFKNGRQVGQATSHTFSPILKKYIALGTVERRYAEVGNQLDMEFTIEFVHQNARANIVQLPFFNPARKRA